MAFRLKGFDFALSEDAAAAVLEEPLILLSLLTVSIASSSISSAVKSTKEVKTETSAQYGMVVEQTQYQDNVNLSSFADSIHTHAPCKNNNHDGDFWAHAV